MTKHPPHDPAAEAGRLSALRMQLLELHPFWGYLLLQMRLLAAPDLPAYAMTDCVSRIWFNSSWTATLTLRELGFVMMHEICHQLLASNARQGNRERRKWNRATDYAINDLVAGIPNPGAGYCAEERMLYRMPENALYSPRYRGWIAETIYEDLCRRGDDGSDDNWVALSLPDGRGETIELPEVSDFGGGIDLHLPCEPDDDQCEELRTRIAAAVENYHICSDRGDIPGELLRRLGFLTRPKMPWRRLLHQYADTVLHRDEYSLAAPNKRFMMHDVVVPGYYNETPGSLVAAVDTSGSMSEEDIRAVVSELRGMVDCAEELTLIVADSEVRQVVSGGDVEAFLAEGKLAGGGGTDHRCVFEYIAEHRLSPGIFVGMSDLYSRFPSRQPPYPVLWLVPECHAAPPWGRVIEM